MRQLDTHLPETLRLCPEYVTKVAEFATAEGAGGVGNPKAVFNLVESNFLLDLMQADKEKYYRLKTEILQYLYHVVETDRNSAHQICTLAYLVVEGNRKINFPTYLLRELLAVYRSEKEIGMKVTNSYLEAISRLLGRVTEEYSFKEAEMQIITRTLTDLYYQNSLSVHKIGFCFKLLQKTQKNKHEPYIYFTGKTKGLSIEWEANRCPFEKGLTLFAWIDSNGTNFSFFRLKSASGQAVELKVSNNVLYLTAATEQNDQPIRICDIEAHSCLLLAVEFQPAGLFASDTFLINVSLNGQLHENILNDAFEFDTSQSTSLHLLDHYRGNLSGLVLTARHQISAVDLLLETFRYGISSQSHVQQLLESKIIKSETMQGIYNAERTFDGMLLNYLHEKKHMHFAGRTALFEEHRLEEKLVDIYMPFLYLLALQKDKDEAWVEQFNHIFEVILNEAANKTDSFLFLIYFMELADYNVTQPTLDFLYSQASSQDNFYLQTVAKCTDVHILTGKGLTYDSQYEAQLEFEQKIILLFHLQTQWLAKWNKMQGFHGWWTPSFFTAQNDKPFNPIDLQHNPEHESRVEWSVMNIVTRDFCKSFIEPVFILPPHPYNNKYQKEYTGKECFTQSLQTPLAHKYKGKVLVCKKQSNSSFDKLKTRFLKRDESSKMKKRAVVQEPKEFESDCLFVDIITIVKGLVQITADGFVIFSSCHGTKSYDHMCIRAFRNESFYYFRSSFEQIRKIYLKRFNASMNAVYIKCHDGRQIMLHFHLQNASTFLSLLQPFVKIKRDSYANYLQAHQPMQWIDKQISNYEYLQWLNEIAGRNYNDMTQYPVLPWTYIAHEDSQQEHLNFRDLGRNMGRQGDADRIRYFLEKYESNNEEELFSQYHFGTHYSSSAIIFNFLIRIRPYSTGALALQGGKFDCADRIFHSFHGSWLNATTSPTDLRELIPQIYTLPEMFANLNNYDYGMTQEKTCIDNVELPPWAGSNPYRFVAKLRKRLESRYVSDNINNWIDLIYGYKQRGRDAIEHMNIFYPLTYENCIDLDKVTDTTERVSFETQIAHFGQNPAQIIGNNPHPSRKAVRPQWQDKLMADGGELLVQKYMLSVLFREQRFLFGSIFEARNSVLSIQFLNNELFFVLRKHEYYLFKVINKRAACLSREQEVPLELELPGIALDYKSVPSFVPVAIINEDIALVGGFFNGHVHLLFLKQPKYNRTYQFNLKTITCVRFVRRHQMLLMGDSAGVVMVYKLEVGPKQIEFEQIRCIRAHDGKINELTINQKANLFCICSQDGSLSLYNLFSHELIRKIQHPSQLPIHFAQITTSPLYAVVLYSREDSSVRIYSINGQFLDSICEKTGFIYNIHILPSTDSTECLVYLNAQREMFIWQLPFLNIKRKCRVKKDDSKISCFQPSPCGKLGVSGTQDGAILLIANPDSL